MSSIAPAAIEEFATLFVGFELSKSTWLIGLYAPELGKTICRHKVAGGDADAALELIATASRRLGRMGKPVRVVSIYEAGFDGFWLHHRLTAAGIESRVIDGEHSRGPAVEARQDRPPRPGTSDPHAARVRAR